MCALGLPHRRFSVLNPTSKSYSFKWRCDDTGSSPFCCLTPCGTIMPGKKAEVRMETHTVNTHYLYIWWCYLITFIFQSLSASLLSASPHPILFHFIAQSFFQFRIFGLHFISISLSPSPHIPLYHNKSNLITSI